MRAATMAFVVLLVVVGGCAHSPELKSAARLQLDALDEAERATGAYVRAVDRLLELATEVRGEARTMAAASRAVDDAIREIRRETSVPSADGPPSEPIGEGSGDAAVEPDRSVQGHLDVGDVIGASDRVARAIFAERRRLRTAASDLERLRRGHRENLSALVHLLRLLASSQELVLDHLVLDRDPEAWRLQELSARLRTMSALVSLGGEIVSRSWGAGEGLDAVAGLMEPMLDLEERLVAKLVRDRDAWRAAVPRLLTAIDGELEVASLFRHRMDRAIVGLERRIAWRRPEIQTAVLLRMAAVDLAIDELAAARAGEIRRLEGIRASALDGLILLMEKVRRNQRELLAHLRDPGTVERIGEIDIGLIATAIVEAQRLRDALGRSPAAKGRGRHEDGKRRIEERMAELRSLLRSLSGEGG